MYKNDKSGKIKTRYTPYIIRNERALRCYSLQADNGSRTRLSSLGSWHSTDEQYLHTNRLYHESKKCKDKKY